MMKPRKAALASASALLASVTTMSGAFAAPVPGGTLDPTSIPKYVQPIVIPPVMKNAGSNNDYDIAVRQFQQQILPGGHWNAVSPACQASPGLCSLPATTLWSYGPASDPIPDSSSIPGGAPGLAPALNSQFNYPAFTLENTSNTPTTVDWSNELVAIDPATGFPYPSGDPRRTYLSHITPVDRSLHWANPEQLACGNPARTRDCRPDAANGGVLLQPYTGPVPIVTHVHGAHVGPESDGYPEAWWLPDASNIPGGYASVGTLVNRYATPTNNNPGIASFRYPNDQPSTTLWYHDHTLGMTRNNVYAGPAGFWLIREANGGETGLLSGTLPGPAPVAGDDPNFDAAKRSQIREIPIVIQGRSFNADGSLFYPANRAFFEGLGDGQQSGRLANLRAGLSISTIGTTGGRLLPSDISPIWNPEAFFNVMVVNGVSWPTLDVEPDVYRLRLLNGCNSRFLNLSLQALDAAGAIIDEVPFYQIGAEQSLLPNVVKIVRGARATLPGNGTEPALTAAPALDFADPAVEETAEGLLMGLAERADVLVDFGKLPANTVRVRMVNTAPDAPFGGFPDVPADPDTSGQVMEFVLVANTPAGDAASAPADLVLSLPDAGDPANGPALPGARDLALLEEESLLVCATVRPNGRILQDLLGIPDQANPGTCVHRRKGTLRNSVPFAPKAAVLGVNGAGGGTVQLWSDPIAQNPAVGTTETWELWNWSADAHPIHLHLVKFKVVDREVFDPVTGALQGPRAPELTEAGWKDTVIAYPGEVTRVNATFDIEGLYVWHCHIVEHEDNEMMVPYCVGDKANAPGCSVVP